MPSSLTRVLPSPLVSSTRPPVSVCGTDAARLARGFSGHHGSLPLAEDVSSPRTPSSDPVRGFAAGPPAWLDASLRRDNLGASPPRSSRLDGGAGILTGCPSPTRRRLGLGPPHPEWISLALEPLGIRGAGFAPASRYSYRHSPLPPLHQNSHPGFTADGNAPLPCTLANDCASVASVPHLSPPGLSAPRHLRPVSYYALILGWLLLSQPPGCLRIATTFPT